MNGDIEGVVSAAVEDAGDVGVDTGVDAGAGNDAGGADAGAVAAPPADGTGVAVADDPFAKEHGIVAKRSDGRENRIPYSRVKAIAEARERKTIAAVAQHLGITKAEAELRMEDVTGALTERGTKMTEYETRLSGMDQIESIMGSDGDRFIRMMASANPTMYGKFAALLDAPPPASTQDTDLEPEPDYPLDKDNPNSPKTYSLEGLRKLREWDRRQAAKAAKVDFDKELAPIKDRYKHETEREQAERQTQDRQQKVKAQLDKAATWKGFVEHNKEILAAFNADKTLSVHDAYMKVMLPKFAADRTTMRQEIMAELKGAPASTSTTSTQTPAAKGGHESVEDIIRAAVSTLK